MPNILKHLHVISHNAYKLCLSFFVKTLLQWTKCHITHTYIAETCNEEAVPTNSCQFGVSDVLWQEN